MEISVQVFYWRVLLDKTPMRVRKAKLSREKLHCDAIINRDQLISRGALELGWHFRIGHASRQGDLGLQLLCRPVTACRLPSVGEYYGERLPLAKTNF